MTDKQTDTGDSQTNSSETASTDVKGSVSEANSKEESSTLPSDETNTAENVPDSSEEPPQTGRLPQDKNERTDRDISQFNTGHPIGDEWLNAVAGAEITESSARTYEGDLRRWIRESDRPLLEAEVEDVIQSLRGAARDGLSEETINGMLTSIRGVYKYMRLETDAQPEMDIVELGELSGKNYNTPDSNTPEPLEPEELEKLVGAIDGRRNQLFVIVGAETGARNESLSNIKVGDVDLDKQEIEVENIKTGGTYTAPISGALALELERWLTVQREAYIQSSECDFLFPSKRTGSITSGQLRYIVKSAAERAGIQDILRQRPATEAEQRAGYTCETVKYYRVTPHTLRHTFAYFLEQTGVSTDHISDALDHDSTEITETYLHKESDYDKMVRRFLHDEEIDTDDDDEDFGSPADIAL